MSEVTEAPNYYTENYPDYDLQNSPGKLAFYLDILGRHVAKGKKLFEFGVGQGNFLKEASRHYKVAGCDVNAHGVAATRAKVPGAKIEEGSSEALPPAGSTDAVVSFDVLEHVPDLNPALRAIHQTLPANGVLIAVVPVYDGPLGWLIQILDKDPTHVNKFARQEWLDRIGTAGFEVVEYGGILRKLVGKTYLHFTRPQWLLRSSGVAVYFVARKRA